MKSSFMGFIWLVLAVSVKSLASILVREAAIVSTGEGVFGFLINPWLIGAYISLGLQSVFWVLALRQFTLILAYPVLQLSFVINIVAAHLVFNEIILIQHAVGIGLITLGTAIVSLASRGGGGV